MFAAIPKPQENLQTSYPEFPNQALNIGLSTSALFDTRAEDLIFRNEGEEAYRRVMREKESVPFEPGTLLPFLRKMMGFNTTDNILVNFTLLSRAHPSVSRRVHLSLYAHGLTMQTPRGKLRFGMGEAYMQGRAITPSLLRNFGVDCFFTPCRADVESALRAGLPAGQVFPDLPYDRPAHRSHDVLIAFDFDRVLALAKGKPNDRFKLDSEAYFRKEGLLRYWQREARLTTYPAHPGPFAAFYLKLSALRETIKKQEQDRKLELAIVTARSSDPFARIQSTLTYWGGEDVMEDYRLSTRRTPKAHHLAELKADLFLDDSEAQIQQARPVTAAVLVPHVRPKNAPSTIRCKNKKADNQSGAFLSLTA